MGGSGRAGNHRASVHAVGVPLALMMLTRMRLLLGSMGPRLPRRPGLTSESLRLAGSGLRDTELTGTPDRSHGARRKRGFRKI